MSAKAAHRLATGNDALTKLLAPSEVEIMRIVWTCGPCTVRTLYDAIVAERDVAYMTIKTTTDRLVGKGLLRRSEERREIGGRYAYTAAISEEAFIAQRLADILGAVKRDYPAALAQVLASSAKEATNALT
jgi:predicted transcriptional regulator